MVTVTHIFIHAVFHTLYPLTTLVLYALARRLFDARIAFWTALTCFTLPGVAFSSQVLPSVSGDYQPLVGDFAGDTHDDILWRTPGSTRAYLWTSQGDGTFVSTTRTVPAANQASTSFSA